MSANPICEEQNYLNNHKKRLIFIKTISKQNFQQPIYFKPPNAAEPTGANYYNEKHLPKT